MGKRNVGFTACLEKPSSCSQTSKPESALAVKPVFSTLSTQLEKLKSNPRIGNKKSLCSKAILNLLENLDPGKRKPSISYFQKSFKFLFSGLHIFIKVIFKKLRTLKNHQSLLLERAEKERVCLRLRNHPNLIQVLNTYLNSKHGNWISNFLNLYSYFDLKDSYLKLRLREEIFPTLFYYY